VSQLLPKRPRIRLDAKAYHTLRRNVLDRDGWRCEACALRPDSRSIASGVGAIQAMIPGGISSPVFWVPQGDSSVIIEHRTI
jgi:hypothetical protein